MLLRKKTNGFTLVELLVVISILAILAAALTAQVTKARTMGQALRCKANLYNLAKAALNYGVDHECMPWAGSYERVWPEIVTGKFVPIYHEYPGWVAWTGSGKWTSRDMQCGQMKRACYFGETAYQSITNGTLWSYAGKDLAAYTCDVHKSVAKRAGRSKVMRSYVMNGYFGFDHKSNPSPANMPDWHEIRLDSVSARGSAASLLLFAEMPAYKGASHAEDVAGDEHGPGSDGVLETDTSSCGYGTTQTEILGFNHQVAKRYVAHVAYADGHADVLIEPKGIADTDLKELARQLCCGDEVSQDLREKMR